MRGGRKVLRLKTAGTYAYASYWYAGDPTLINRVPATNIQVLKDEQGNMMDTAEVVVRCLQSPPHQTADPVLHRINLLRPLPLPLYGNNGEVRSRMGASP